MNNQEKEDAATLEILQVIENKKDITQRHLADRLGIALGLTNSYLKRCARKGLVKIHQAPANRYFYYLTPKGFAEKSRLTAEYLSVSFSLYRRANDSFREIYEECRQKKWEKIILCGVSELAEIASIGSLDHNMFIVGTWDPYSNKKQFLHRPVWKNLDDVEQFDACLLTTLNNTNAMYELLCEQKYFDRVFVPSILGINTINKETQSQ